MRATLELLFCPTSPLHARLPTGVNQFGMKPTSFYDFLNPTQLVNHGKSTTVETLATRRAPTPGDRGSSPSLDSLAIGRPLMEMLGVRESPTATSRGNTFCSQETAALRICMAKGESSCEKENRMLEACLNRVAPLREAISKAGQEYQDWFTQNVSDHYTKPFTHRPQDHKEKYAMEFQVWRGRQWGKAYGAHPRKLKYESFFNNKGSGKARHSRLPVNA